MMTQLILAIQGDSAQKAKRIYKATEGWIDIYKIGIDLFTHSGTRLITYFTNQDAKVFLDLKFCDIPTVVARACEICAKFKVTMFTIHTMGGIEMMRMCAEHLNEFCSKKRIKPRPLILGVTILTSVSNQEFAKLWGTKSKIDMSSHITRLAGLAKDAGLDGVICSAHEITAIKKECGSNFLTVVPGIRVIQPSETENEALEGAKVINDDQARSDTPESASRLDADYIVVGRPIIRALDPIAVIEKIQEDIKKGSKY
jgi:orotidine-5'-phosphate decarboxylase